MGQYSPVAVSFMKGNTIKTLKGHYSVKTESRVMVLFLCILSDDAVYLYKML